MEDKRYAICESILKNRRRGKLITTLLKFDRSLMLEDLINEVYLYHHTKDIYPSVLTVNRVLINMCESLFRAKKSDNRAFISGEIDFDRVVDPISSVDNCDYILVKDLVKKLRKNERELIYLYFYEGKTLEEIGLYIGKSREYVRITLKSIVGTLRIGVN